MVKVYSEDALSYSRVKEWAKCFNEGRESLEDEAKSVRPISVITPQTIDIVRNIVEDDPHSTTHKIASHLDISTGSVDDILFNHLEFRKFSSRWAPHTLTESQKSTCLSCAAKELLKIYEFSDYGKCAHEQSKIWLPKGATPTLILGPTSEQ